jgi:hypothetical protein
MSVVGGAETEIPALRPIVRFRYWNGNKRGIYFLNMEGAQPALDLYEFSTGRVVQIAAPNLQPIPLFRGLSVSPDGHSFLWVQRGPATFAQVMLVRRFR